MHFCLLLVQGKKKKLRFQKSHVKTMLVIFFNWQRVIHKEFIPEGETINAVYHKGVMERLLNRIWRFRPGMCDIWWMVPFERQPPVPQCDNRQAVFGPTYGDCAQPPSVFARFSTGWLPFVPKSEIPLEGVPLWLDFGHPDSRDKYIKHHGKGRLLQSHSEAVWLWKSVCTVTRDLSKTK